MSLTAFLFVIGFLAACVLALFRHPIFGLLAYIGVDYLHPPSRWWGQGMLLDVRWSLVAAAVTLLAVAARGRSLNLGKGFLGFGVVWGILAFVAWLGIQLFWAINPDNQLEMIEYYLKFVVAMFLIYSCIDSERHLWLFLWSHVLGCFYFGWIAYTTYEGGRFQGFGGPGFDEANIAALQLVTGIIVAASLFMVARWKERLAIIGIMPFIVNAIVTTISRSGFLAFATSGLLYNHFVPRKYRGFVRILSVAGLALFLLLTNDVYWSRIETIKFQGEEVEGLDTGSGRLEIIQAQLRMAQAHPLGCGHMCTTDLSPSYMDEGALYLGGRSSHNTFMSMLVEQGIPGAVAYVALVVWGIVVVARLSKRLKDQDGLQATVFPAVAAACGAIVIGDQFVPYVRFETRFWFIALLLVLLRNTSAMTATPSNNLAASR